MTLPSREEIRRKALELWYKYYAPKTGSYTTPSEEELKELGLWQEAQLELMRSEATRLENMIEEATAQDIEQLYQAIEELMNRLDELEQEIKKRREKQARRQAWRKILRTGVEAKALRLIEQVEKQTVEAEDKDKITPEQAQQIYNLLYRAREKLETDPEASLYIAEQAEEKLREMTKKKRRKRKHAPSTTLGPQLGVTVPPPPPPNIPIKALGAVTATPAGEQPIRIYLRLHLTRVCFDRDTEGLIATILPRNMKEYIKSCEYIEGSKKYSSLDAYIRMNEYLFKPVTLWDWVADVTEYVRKHLDELAEMLARGYRIYFEFPEVEPRIEGYR